MFRKHLTILATVAATLAPMVAQAQPAPGPAPQQQQQAAPRGPGLEILVPLAILVVLVGALAHDH